MSSLDEKRKTIANDSVEIKEAKIIANYGDPGILENYHFDILSRFLICELESTDRILTNDKWKKMIVAVKRPEHLWINTNVITDSITDQARYDYFGNSSKGLATNYSINGISSINQPYNLGDIIKIRKLQNPYTINGDNNSIFLSKFKTIDSTNNYYDTWHSTGSDSAYISNNNAQLLLRQKCITSNASYYFYPTMNKYQYEAFMLSISSNTDLLTLIFSGKWNGSSKVYSANGGYVFNENTYINIPIIEYEDTNIDNRKRETTNSCLPLIVSVPSSWPIPKTRSTGLINYTPTVSNIN